MEKLKVSKKIASGLKELLSRSRDDYSYDFILQVQATDNNWDGEKWLPLRELSVSEMAQAIYVGYETQNTPEENILELYNSTNKKGEFDPECRLGIKYTLNYLGVKIKGINS